MRESRLKTWLINALGGFGWVVWMALAIAVHFAPLYMLDFPWWADVLILAFVFFFAEIGAVLMLPLWIWALIETIHGPHDTAAILFYICCGLSLPALLSSLTTLVLLFCRMLCSRKFWGFMLVLCLMAGSFLAGQNSDRIFRNVPGLRDKIEAAFKIELPTPVPTEKPLVPKPFPASGTCRNYTNALAVAPFEVITPKNDPDNYYICLYDDVGKKIAVALFLGPGKSAEVSVPTGIYTMYIASGGEWYGVSDKFGKAGSYSKADKPLAFSKSDDYYNGHTISLQKVASGNFDTDSISYERFP